MSRRLSTPFVIGLVVIGVGILLLLGSTGVLDTGEVFKWAPSLFILYGLWLLVVSRFRSVFWPLFLMLAAGFGQLILLGIDIGDFWPVILIVLGSVILINSFRTRRGASQGTDPDSVTVFGSERKVAPADQDSINMVSVMGSATQRIISSEFRGGRATAVMGEAEIDLRESSVLEKPAVLELSVVMGEIRLRVPGDWNIRVDDDTIMGELKDERVRRETSDSETDLVVKGSIVMGSLKIED